LRSALVARGRSVAYILVEVSIGAGMFLVTWALMENLGIAAANLAHAIVWAAAFAWLVILHRQPLFEARSGTRAVLGLWPRR
jgi:hypothetical protein